MADDLPSKLVMFSRAQIVGKYKRSYTVRCPSGNTDKGTLPDIDANVIADLQAPLYGDAQTIALNAALANKSMVSAIAYADSIGLVPNHLPASGSSGFVAVRASSAGGVIVYGTECRDTLGNVFACAVTGLYGDGAQVPIFARTTGPLTNAAANTVLTWDSAPAGIGSTCTVVETSSGAGLTGGSDEETLDELISRIRDRQENPPSAGNDSAFQAYVENFPGIAIQKAFTVPAVNGCGSTAVMFTLRPDRAGGSRIPNATQIAQVRAGMLGEFPADDSDFFCALVASNVTLALQVSWTRSAVGWADASPWPVFTFGDMVVRDGAVAATPTSMRLKTATTQVAPQVGQTIGFYDSTPDIPVFRRKQIKTVAVISAGLVWDLTFEDANGASDLTFTPVNGAPVSPWSDSLDLLVTPTLLYFDGIGPGEQVSSPYDAGLRQKRQPEGPEQWPNELTGRVQTPIYALSVVKDVSVLSPALPYVTPVGVPGVSSKLLQLGNFAVFEQ